jgi:ADP-ribose pyrophosphatase
MTAQVLGRTLLHKGRVFDVTTENISLSNGITVDMDIIRHPGAAAIVAVTDSRQVLMLRQYRHAIGKIMWEIPAGTREADEDPLVCAKREFTEETGYAARQWDQLGAITPVPGYSDERIFLFLARDLTISTQNLDTDEIIQVRKVPFKKVIDLITKGQIEDAKTIAAIFLAMQVVGHT